MEADVGRHVVDDAIESDLYCGEIDIRNSLTHGQTSVRQPEKKLCMHHPPLIWMEQLFAVTEKRFLRYSPKLSCVEAEISNLFCEGGLW